MHWAISAGLGPPENAMPSRATSEPQMLAQRRDAGLADGGILLAVAARGGNRADALPVDHDRIAADEHREAALVLREDAERLLAGQRVLVGIGRLAVAGGGEGLVDRD